MKKRKRQKLDERKDAKRKEWETIQQLREDERIWRIISGHFEIEDFVIRTERGFAIPYDETVKKLSCENCVHFIDEDCRGKKLIGEMVMDCLKQDSHRDCDIGIYEMDDEEFDDTV